MTKLKNRPVLRETSAFDRVDPLIVELHPTHLVVRTKKKNGQRVEIAYLALLRWGAKVPGPAAR